MTGHTNHPNEDELVLFFYGEPDNQGEVQEHIDKCEACQSTIAKLRKTLETIDSHSIPYRGEQYGREVWARIEPQLEAAAPRTWWSHLSWFAPRHLALAGSLALLLVAAFVAGRHWSAPQTASNVVQRPEQGRGADSDVRTTSDQTAAQPNEGVLLFAVGDHLEKSQLVLVELMNTPGGKRVDISGAQAWARDLVPTNRLIRQTADEAGEPVVADVLDDLERLLVEVANSPSQVSGAELQKIRNRVDSQGLLFKMRVLDSQLRQREDYAVAPGPRSRS